MGLLSSSYRIALIVAISVPLAERMDGELSSIIYICFVSKNSVVYSSPSAIVAVKTAVPETISPKKTTLVFP
ncbi:hypothetical protein ES708_34365 [subsurface metagenome]